MPFLRSRVEVKDRQLATTPFRAEDSCRRGPRESRHPILLKHKRTVCGNRKTYSDIQVPLLWTVRPSDESGNTPFVRRIQSVVPDLQGEEAVFAILAKSGEVGHSRLPGLRSHAKDPQHPHSAPRFRRSILESIYIPHLNELVEGHEQ